MKDPLVTNPDGTVPYDNTVRAKLFAMAYAYDPARARVKPTGFTGWKDTTLCYLETARAVKQRNNPSDSIVILGSARLKTPAHAILVDKQSKVVFDNNEGTHLEGTYVPGEAVYSKRNGKLLYDDLYRVSVKDFLNKTMNTEERSMFIPKAELAKVDDVVMEDVLKSLYLIMYYVFTEQKDLSVPAGLKKKAASWEASLITFLKTFRIPNDDFVALLKAARNSSTFTSSIAEKPPTIGNMLLKAKDKFTQDNTVSAQDLKMLELFGKYFRTDNEKVGVTLLKLAGRVREPELLAMLAVEDAEGVVTKSGDQKKLHDLLRQLSKKFLGGPLTSLTSAQKKEFKTKAPDAYKRYRKAREQWLEAPKNFLKATVRGKGVETIDYQLFLDLLKKNKFSHAYPMSFVGRIDEFGNFYTAAGNKLQANPSAEVVMNPKYIASQDNAYVCVARKPGMKTASKIYTEQWVTGKRVDKKFGTMEAVKDEGVEGIRKKWLAHILTGTGRLPIVATQLEMIYLFGARPGASSNKATANFGITTLLVKHLTKKGSDYHISYAGKGGTAMDWVIKAAKSNVNKKMVSILDSLVSGKGPNDPLWTDEKGKIIPSQFTLNYAKSSKVTGNPKATLYTFRYLAADGVARKELAKFKPQSKDKAALQQEADDFFKNAMLAVGAELKHHTGQMVTGNTATKNYINPEILYKFFLRHGLRITNKNIPTVQAASYKKWLAEVAKESKSKK